jgi:hypothetical protein
MKILLGPVEIAGYYQNLAKGIRSLGVHCDFVTWQTHVFEYGGENELFAFNILKKVTQFRSRISKFNPTKILVVGLQKICEISWVLFCILRYDGFVFGFGESLLPGNKDLPILKFFKKKVISNLAHGSEARPPYIDGSFLFKDNKCKNISEILNASVRIKNRVTFHEKYSTYIIGAPNSTSQFSNKKFINVFHLGLPNCLDDNDEEKTITYSTRKAEQKKIRILHSPSNPIVKGTILIEKVIEKLKKQNFNIEFVVITNRPFAEVVAEIKKCDFVIDQIYNDTPMAGFASEAAWFGKPSIVGGYSIEELKKTVPDSMWPPSMVCHPDRIEEGIRELIMNNEKRIQLGEDAKKFVKANWNSRILAEKYMKIFQGDFPKEWFFEPVGDFYFLSGHGLSLEQSKIIVKEIVNKYGLRGLCLDHNPILLSKFHLFCNS